MRIRPILRLLAVLGLVVIPLLQAPSVVAGERTCFGETTHCAENAFLSFWRTSGDLPILGFPISQPLYDDHGRLVQYFERAIMEWHPDNPSAYRVLLARLGADRLGDRPERAAPATPCGDGCHTFAETGHTLRGVFARYWSAHGGLPVFGFPLTEEFEEVSPTDGQTYIVQYFERNRFEWHPEQAGTSYEVLLGLLGAEALQGQPELLDRPAVAVPDYPRLEPGVPERLIVPTLAVNAPIAPVGVDEQGNMAAPGGAWETTWYAPGPRPGEPGNAVIAGHVDYYGVGPALFWSLHQLTPGAEVWVTGDNGSRRRFLVERVETYPLTEVPLDQVFGWTETANLNLISCAGDFDPVSRTYDQRIVVYTRWDGRER